MTEKYGKTKPVSPEILPIVFTLRTRGRRKVRSREAYILKVESLMLKKKRTYEREKEVDTCEGL
jgi:hypothetical protein